MGLFRPPPVSLSARAPIEGLGLQNNNIEFLSIDYLQTFPQLLDVDVSNQRHGQCVGIDFQPEAYHYNILGKILNIFFNVFKKTKDF